MICIRKFLRMQFLENRYEIGYSLHIEVFADYFRGINGIDGTEILLQCSVIITPREEVVAVFLEDGV